MLEGKEERRVSLQDVDELLALRAWSKTDLASELDMSEAAVWKWYRVGRPPRGATSILLRQWLEEARAEAKANGRKLVKA